MPTEYRPLHKYLDGRFADTVVLTLGEIEDLLGFALPALALADDNWWGNPGGNGEASAQSRSWTQANRTAKPNLRSRTVVFERVSTPATP